MWFYGTSRHRQEIEQIHESFEAKHSVKNHENEQAGYSKYFPNQTRRDFDKATKEVFDVTINDRGFRGRDFDEVAKPGTVRVVTLGASSTFGYHNRDDETYPALLERILNERCDGAPFEVVNLGVPHLTTAQVLALFRNEALALRPDVVTFYEGINDCSQVRKEQSSVSSVKRNLGRVSFLSSVFRTLKSSLITVAYFDDTFAGRMQTLTEQDLEANVAAKLSDFVPNLELLRQECAAAGIELIVVSQQVQSLLFDDAERRGMTYAEEQERVRALFAEEGGVRPIQLAFLTHADLMRDLERWVGESGVRYVDAIEALDARRDVLVSWVHLNAEGNALLAEALAGPILDVACTSVR